MNTNNPPTDANPLKDRLAQDYASNIDRRDELLEAVDRVPNPITDEDDAKKVADFIKLLAAAKKDADSHRVSEKEPYLSSGRTVDGFFKAITDPLDNAKKSTEKILTSYQLAKAAAERRARQEEERRLREEAERVRLEAEHAAREAQTEGQLEDAIAEEEMAQAMEAAALAAEKDADANKAELSRTRGDEGAVASLRTFWDFKNLDRDTLDLETLRQHIPEEALKSAVRSYVKAGGRTLSGVIIFENATSVVR